MTDPLAVFSAPVRIWFHETFGQPTPPQAAGWPAIQRGDHTLILAPTGSGKTLAAFLWGIDRIWQEIAMPESGRRQAEPGMSCERSASSVGVHLLYISPLKALNNDIERNLRAPLTGIRAVAERLGLALPPLRVAVRTGDTPSGVRAAMLKQPPHILITTPESLYLLLTSPRARDILRPVQTVIVDEIHTLVGEKRGAHLALSLERLEQLAGRRIQRIGLSATVKPLEEAARFLGGQEPAAGEQKSEVRNGRPGDDAPGAGARAAVPADHLSTLSPRPVTIVDTGYRKPLDLRVVTAVDDFRAMPGDSVWPTVIPQVLGDVMRHRSTLIFCNNRRLAERTADRLNAQLAAERSEELPPGSTEALAPAGIMRDRGIFAIGAEGPIRAHHGSMSQEARRQMEEDLKAGKLPALVGTSSLELGIDIGAVDLVVQLQSPKSVSQGLQRVGRSGHLVGQTSRGRIYATFREDLVEAAAVARGMLEGDVEPTVAPHNPLDVLAQQIVAMVSVEEWRSTALFDLVRRAYPYRDLSRAAFVSVLDMLAGKYQAVGGPGHSSLRPRIAWDRVNDRLAALPGTRLLALSNAGTIADTGAYDVYLADGKTRVGQLDEEFVFETRVGDTFLLGSNTWRVLSIENDRIVVGEAAGVVPRMPFWRGDYPWRPFELGLRIGRLRREVAERLEEEGRKAANQGHRSSDGDRRLPLIAWLQQEYALDERSARQLVDYVQSQLDAVGVISSDRTIVVESFTDAVGEARMVIHSPFGGRVNGAWALALSHALTERFGLQVETQTDDDGILFRYPGNDRPAPTEIVARMTFAEAKERILRELPDSALFGARFRMNAGRALLLPKARGQKRTPFWLQRLKAKDLLASVRRSSDFPLLVETYRDCLADVLDLPHLEQVLDGIERGDIRVVPIETLVPSPIAAGLLHSFISVYMYEWDLPKAERQLQQLALRQELLDDLLVGAESGTVSQPAALAEAVGRAQHLTPETVARSADELIAHLLALGDLTTAEVAARCAGDGMAWLAELAAQHRICELNLPTAHGSEPRWVPAELADEYREAFALGGKSLPATVRPAAADQPAAKVILRRFLRRAGPVTRSQILTRYAFPADWLDATLERLVAERELVRGHLTAGEETEAAGRIPTPSPVPPELRYCDRHLFEQIQRRTVAILRRAVEPVPLAAYAHFMACWQGVVRGEAEAWPAQGPAQAGQGVAESKLRETLYQLRGLALPVGLWERDVLPARVPGFDTTQLAALCEAGELVWVAAGREGRQARVRFFGRGEGGLFLGPSDETALSAAARQAYAYLRSEGASFLADLQAGLGLAAATLQAAIVELALAGLATNDTLDALHAVLSYHALPEDGKREPFSALEAELAQRLSAVQGSRPLTSDRYHAARRRVSQRLRAAPIEAASDLWRGRWSVVHRASVLGPVQSDEARALAQARALLQRYGIVTRDCLQREEGPWTWDALYEQLQRMELRGEVRRGYFVAGLPGLQFALPRAVELLRAAREVTDPVVTSSAPEAQPACLVLNAADPANIYGGEGPAIAPAFARLPSAHVVLWRGRLLLVAEDNGARWTVAEDAPHELIRAGLAAYLARPYAPSRVTVTHWNGVPVMDSAGQPILKDLGFTRTPHGLERWVSILSITRG